MSNISFEDAILSFEEIQEELNYKQAQNSLKNLVNNLDLSSQEQAGLEIQINNLTFMLEKLEQSVVQIAAFGMVGRGKSSVLNALLGKNIFQTGAIHGVTRDSDVADWDFNANENRKARKVTLKGFNNSRIQLIDTPGIDEVNGEERERLAIQMAKQVDLILFVISEDLCKVEYEALSRLRDVGKPMILVFNKIDRYPEADRLAIYHKIKDDRVKELLSPDEIVMVAASPLVTEKVQGEDGRVKIKRYRGESQIDDLKVKILDILEREGKSLVAINTMLCAGEVNQKLVQRKMLIRATAAKKLIGRAVMIKAMAIALNPVTALDLFSGAIIDVAMILTLSHLYGIPMTQKAAVGLLQKIAMAMGGISASELLASLGLSSLKGILGISAPLTGGISLLPYFSIAITQGAVAGFSSYAIGQITQVYLANGACWGPDGPNVVVTRILESLDKGSILNRIKSELSSKLKKHEFS